MVNNILGKQRKQYLMLSYDIFKMKISDVLIILMPTCFSHLSYSFKVLLVEKSSLISLTSELTGTETSRRKLLTIIINVSIIR